MLLSRRKGEQIEAQGLSLPADHELRQLSSTLLVTPLPRVEGGSDCRDLAWEAVRRVASMNSETRAAVP
jgi:hypothetical protein